MGIFSGKPLVHSTEIIAKTTESSVRYVGDEMGNWRKQINTTIENESKSWRPVVVIASENFGQNFMRGTVASVLNNPLVQFLIGSIGCLFAAWTFVLLQPLIEQTMFMTMSPMLTEDNQFNYFRHMNRHTLFIFFMAVTILFASITQSSSIENIILLQIIIFDMYSIIKIVYCAIYFRILLYDLLVWLIVFCITLIITAKGPHSDDKSRLGLLICVLCASDILANIIALIFPYLVLLFAASAPYIYQYRLLGTGCMVVFSILFSLTMYCRKRKRDRNLVRLRSKKLW